MRITKIDIKNFRTYKQLSMSPSKGLNLLLGKNGAGKTNVLESIYFACLMRTPRTNNVVEVIRFNCNYTMVTLEVQHRLTTHEIKILFDREKAKKVLIDGEPAKGQSEVLQKVGIVYFCPEDLRLVQDGAQRRRKFLDIGMAVANLVSHEVKKNYNDAIIQKNQILKQYKNLTGEEYDAWDVEIARFAWKIMQERENYIARISKIARKKYREISQTEENLALTYMPSYGDVKSAKDIHNIIVQDRQKEIERGNVIRGIHRDDILITINGEDARKYASQGQQRSIVLALKLSELEVYKEAKGESAILLLDDVLSELDDTRKKALVKIINNQQTFVSATEYPHEFEGYKYEVTRNQTESFVTKVEK